MVHPPMLSKSIVDNKDYLIGPVHLCEHLLKFTIDIISALFTKHTELYPTNTLQERMDGNLNFWCNMKQIKGR